MNRDDITDPELRTFLGMGPQAQPSQALLDAFPLPPTTPRPIKGKPMTPAYMRKTINDAFATLDRLADICTYEGSRNLQQLIRDAVDAELVAEREHRRMGKRFTDGRAGYRVGAQITAEFHVAKRVAQALVSPPQPPVSFDDVSRYRHSVTITYALAEGIRECVKTAGQNYQASESSIRRAQILAMESELRNHDVLGIDYAQDIAA